MFDRTPAGLDIGSSRILIVDDEPVNVELAERVLRRAGFGAVESTTDPTEVVARFRASRPHAVLLDLHMPGLDGFSVLDQLQPDLSAVGTAVIVITAEGDRDSKLAALRRGAHDFIMKPFDPLEMVSRVRNACEVQELHRRLRDENERLEDAVRNRTARLEEAVEVLRQAEATLTRNVADAEARTRARDHMLAEAAHDFRTPLNAICGFAEIIRDQSMGPVGNPRYAEYAGEIHGAAQYLLNVAEDVLDLAKLQAGEDRLHLRDVPVHEVVRSSVELLRGEAERAGVRLSVRMPPGPLRVRTDETKLRRILVNMTSNALKFTPAGGSVTVEVGVDSHGGAFVLIIRDTGVGIAPEDLPTALRPFGQVRGLRQGNNGTGLGMPLTKALVEALGGRFEIASEPGRGTCVTIRLPADAAAAHRAA
jgi:signal transduction histidine kinase